MEEHEISCTDMYNIMNDGSKFSCYIHNPLYLLILDTRPMADYSLHHIQTAFHCTAVHSSVVSQRLQDFTRIVVYGCATELDENESAEKAIKFLGKQEVDYEVLIGGYSEFSSRFPFLCNTVTVWAQTERERKLITFPSLILEDWLYQGSGDQAKNEAIVKVIGITHIVNISTEHQCILPGVKYLAIRLQDDASSKLIEHFEEIFEFLDEAKRTEGRALVHCNLGISRSSTATLSYMMLSECCSLLDAYNYLHHRRPCCAPNRGFFLQLGQFEEYIFGKSLTDAAELWMAI